MAPAALPLKYAIGDVLLNLNKSVADTQKCSVRES